MVNGKIKFEDNTYSKGTQALYWANLGESDGAMATLEKAQNIEWKRASDVFPSAKLWGSQGITP